MDNLTLGSLFDGSGGFPLGGLLCGITPVWASEIEPFPIRVTTKRLPYMKHYGDISTMDGGTIGSVDIITFGSPCTDMSIAGKRVGLDGSQSRLFYEAIRIIKEMRCKTDGRYPRWICWENVPGAFSSNSGTDFKAVLDAFIQLACPEAEVPMPESGRWPYVDLYTGNGWSVAYRTLDAQYFGVPQRRRRIYLVADLAGRSAGKVLFEPEGVSRDFTPGCCAWQGAAGDTENSFGETVGFEPGALARMGGHAWSGLAGTLRADMGDNQTAVATSAASKTLKIRSGCDGGGKGALIQNNMSATLGCSNDQTLFIPTAYGICSDKSNSMLSGNPHSGIYEASTSRTLDANGGDPGCNQGGVAIVAPMTYSMTTGSYGVVSAEQSATLMARDYKDAPVVNQPDYIVRRLTPTECARLQGFPDWWCSNLGTENPTEDEIVFWADVWETHRRIVGKSTKPKSHEQIIKWLREPHSDSAEYKLWGNGVALPCVYFVLAGIVWAAKNA